MMTELWQSKENHNRQMKSASLLMCHKANPKKMYSTHEDNLLQITAPLSALKHQHQEVYVRDRSLHP